FSLPLDIARNAQWIAKLPPGPFPALRCSFHFFLLGIQRLRGANRNFDLLWFRFGPLVEVDAEHAGIVAGLHALWIHRGGNRERPVEAAVAPLDAVEVLFFLFTFELPLPL